MASGELERGATWERKRPGSEAKEGRGGGGTTSGRAMRGSPDEGKAHVASASRRKGDGRTGGCATGADERRTSEGRCDVAWSDAVQGGTRQRAASAVTSGSARKMETESSRARALSEQRQRGCEQGRSRGGGEEVGLAVGWWAFGPALQVRAGSLRESGAGAREQDYSDARVGGAWCERRRAAGGEVGARSDRGPFARGQRGERDAGSPRAVARGRARRRSASRGGDERRKRARMAPVRASGGGSRKEAWAGAGSCATAGIRKSEQESERERGLVGRRSSEQRRKQTGGAAIDGASMRAQMDKGRPEAVREREQGEEKEHGSRLGSDGPAAGKSDADGATETE